jgi:hypothetical protein
MRTTRSNSSPFGQFRGQRADAGRRPERGIADDAGDPVGVRGEPGVEDRAPVRNRPVYHGEVAAADRGRHVGVREHGPDDRLGFGHHLFRRPVVDAQGSQVHLVEPDSLEPFRPRLRELDSLNTPPRLTSLTAPQATLTTSIASQIRRDHIRRAAQPEMIFDRYQRPSAQSQLPDHVDCTKAIGSGAPPAVRRSDEMRSNRVGCRGVEGAGRMLISLFTESLLDREGTPRSAAPLAASPWRDPRARSVEIHNPGLVAIGVGTYGQHPVRIAVFAGDRHVHDRAGILSTDCCLKRNLAIRQDRHRFTQRTPGTSDQPARACTAIERCNRPRWGQLAPAGGSPRSIPCRRARRPGALRV